MLENDVPYIYFFITNHFVDTSYSISCMFVFVNFSTLWYSISLYTILPTMDFVLLPWLRQWPEECRTVINWVLWTCIRFLNSPHRPVVETITNTYPSAVSIQSLSVYPTQLHANCLLEDCINTGSFIMIMVLYVTMDLMIMVVQLGNASDLSILISMVSCQKGPTRHAYAWHIGPFWQDTLDML